MTQLHRIQKFKESSLEGADFVRAVGDGLHARVEDTDREERVDHVWIRLDAGTGPPIRVAVNTSSLKSAAVGADPRVRVGFVRGKWETLPRRGINPCEGFDYRDWEARHNVYYEPYEREALERLLFDLSLRARLLEVWGAPYHRGGVGIHQVHSRHASTAVPEGLRNRDGALRFYFAPQHTWKLVLLKFDGQP